MTSLIKMGQQEQQKFRRLMMHDLQDFCETQPDWNTLNPSEKLKRRVSRLASFEMNERALYLHSRESKIRKRLNTISARAEDGRLSDLATLLLISIEATRLIDRLARRDPTYVSKIAYIMGCWPLLCKNQAKLDPEQLSLLEDIGIARPDEFRIGVPQSPKTRGVVSKEAAFIFLWMLDHWKKGHLIEEQSGSAISILFSEEKMWPAWYLEERARVENLIKKLKKKVFKPIALASRKVYGLQSYKDQAHHEEWCKTALAIYTAMVDAGIHLTDGKTGNPEDSAIEQRKQRRGLFKKNFLQLLRGRPGAGRPRKHRR